MSKKKPAKRIINNASRSFRIFTFGCQMNENDSEKISGMLKALGYVEEMDVNKAVWSFLTPVRFGKMPMNGSLAISVPIKPSRKPIPI